MADLRCPDDGHLLRTTNQTPVPFATCRHCDGLWFSYEAIHSRKRATLPAGSQVKRKSLAGQGNRKCPQCANKLQPEEVEDVVIDVCPECGGVWLDRGKYKAARRRSVRMRLAKEAPSLLPPTSKVALFFERVIDNICYAYFEVAAPEPEEPLLRLSLRQRPPPLRLVDQRKPPKGKT
jgi:Zn-finger nucleic acid-binding protein